MSKALLDRQDDLEDVLTYEVDHEGDHPRGGICHDESSMALPDPPIVVAGVEAVSNQPLGRRPVLVLAWKAILIDAVRDAYSLTRDIDVEPPSRIQRRVGQGIGKVDRFRSQIRWKST